MNYFKTALLLAALTALFCAVGYMIGGRGGMMGAFFIALIMNFISYWFSDKIVLRMYGAREVNSGSLYNMVAELAQQASLPMPKVYMIDSPQPNAFATGRNPQNAAVAATYGITEILTAEELRGVMAHELSHIKNRDTLIMTLTATIAGALGMLTNMAMFTGHNGNGRSNAMSSLLIMILAPITAMLVQMAISRTREYAADRKGAEISGDPLALASALQKIQHGAKNVDNHVAEQNPATAHMFIINPLHTRQTDSLFSTHPSTENRVRILHEMAKSPLSKTPVKTSQSSHYKGPWGKV